MRVWAVADVLRHLRRAQQRVESVQRLSLQTLADLRVALERLRQLAVAEELHDDPDMRARLAGPLVVLQEQCAEALAQVVQAHMPQPGLPEESVERAVHVPRLDRRSGLAEEHQRRRSVHAGGVGHLAVPPKSLDRHPGERLPLGALPGLRFLVGSQLLGQAQHRSARPDGPGVEINVRPSQPERLAAAQPCCQVDDPERLQTVAADGSQQRPSLVRAVRLRHVRLGQSWGIGERRDVARQPAVFDGSLQLLFRFVAAAYERCSLGLASHSPFNEWGRFLPEAACRPRPGPRRGVESKCRPRPDGLAAHGHSGRRAWSHEAISADFELAMAASFETAIDTGSDG
ncbi:MAG TPA: hypothetical protein VOB72_24935 [Candidatus Dormibacteraeota bacterium]|nr:hypothetical protein [Candidatus Dormibacteraeota bacterium]